MMEVYTSVMKTNDYSLFKFMEGNRKTSSTNLNQIIQSMEEKQLTIPIIVNERFEIIDGQHRFKACKYLKLPVFYIMQQGYTIDDVIRANVNGGRKWFDVDYLRKYCQANDERYLKIEGILNDFSITANDFIKILAHIQQKKINMLKREFRSGTIELNGVDLLLSFLIALESFKFFKYYKQSNFITAFLRLYFKDGYVHENMERKLNSFGHNLTRQSSADEYLSLLCNKVYSYGSSKYPIYYSSESKKFHQ